MRNVAEQLHLRAQQLLDARGHVVEVVREIGDLIAQRVAPGLGGRRDEIADLAHDFDHMAARIEQLMSAQMQLLGDISHELRSPLARLVVALELAQQKQGGAASSEFERIALESVRMNDLIGQLLTLSRLESGAGQIAAETVDVDARDRGSGGHGLAIAKRAIGLHGGEIGAANHPGGWLEITIRMPLAGGR